MKLMGCLSFVLLVFSHASALHAVQDAAFVETRVKTIVVDPNSQSPVVVLETVTDKRPLPIWIDFPEARAIAMELEQIKSPRPLTHDLIRNLLQKLGANLQRATITDLRNNTYIALLSLNVKGQDVEIDCRPSDAIAVALRMKAPIFASAQVLAKSKPLPPQSGRAPHAQTKMGIQAQDLTPELAKLFDSQEQRGVLVAAVALASPAMRAGLERGDIITKVNGKALASAGDLDSMIQSIPAPAQVKLEVIKKGKPTTVVIDLPS
jgi:bifunctional DNase/RNase